MIVLLCNLNDPSPNPVRSTRNNCESFTRSKANQNTQRVKNERFLMSTRQNIKKRSFLSSCVFWFVFLNASSHLCFRFFESKTCADLLSVCPTPVCIRKHKNNHVRYRSCSPCTSSVDYGNTKRPRMHFTDRRIMYLCTVHLFTRVVSCLGICILYVVPIGSRLQSLQSAPSMLQ